MNSLYLIIVCLVLYGGVVTFGLIAVTMGWLKEIRRYNLFRKMWMETRLQNAVVVSMKEEIDE